MKRILSFILAFTLTLSVFGVFASADHTEGTEPSVALPEIAAGAALVMDADTGTVLYHKNETQSYPVADVAQIVTVLLGLEANEEGKTVTVTKEMLADVSKTSAHISLKEGEEILLIDLLYAVMLASATDAASAVALTVSGTKAQFAAAMTEKAKSLGATGTTFVSPDGLNSGNKTTAADLALILKAALKNEAFRTVFSATSYKTAKTNKTNSYRTLTTLCHLLKESDADAKYEFATGGKSGWSSAAGYSLVATAEKDDRRLICVVLNGTDSKTRYADATALLEYGFAAYCNVTVPATLIGENAIPVIDEGFISKKVALSLPQSIVLTLPIEYADAQLTASALPAFLPEGFDEATLKVTVTAQLTDGSRLVAGEVPLTYTIIEEFERNDTLGTETPVPKTTGAKIWNVVRIILIVLLIIIGILILLAILMFLIAYLQRRKRKIRRRRRLEEQRKAEEEALNSAPTGRRHRKQ